MPLEQYIGELCIYPYNFAPRGWAFCNGQILPISQNQALFSLLGTTYGGDGTSTFALPDLRGRMPVHAGQGPGLSDRTLGQKGGEEMVTLNQSQMPSHTHSVNADNATGRGSGADSDDAAGRILSRPDAPIYTESAATTQMSPEMIGTVGSGQPHDNMSPFLVFNVCIALTGAYPSRN